MSPIVICLYVVAFSIALAAGLWVRQRLRRKPKALSLFDAPLIDVPNGFTLMAYDHSAIFPVIVRDGGLACRDRKMPIFAESELIILHPFGQQHVAERFATQLRDRGYTVGEIVSEVARHEMGDLVA